MQGACTAVVLSLLTCTSTEELCPRIWPKFDALEYSSGWRLRRLRLHVFPLGATIYGEFTSPSQRSLTAKLEARACQTPLGADSLDCHRRLHMKLCEVSGAVAWLTSLANSIETHFPRTTMCPRLQLRG